MARATPFGVLDFALASDFCLRASLVGVFGYALASALR
ncbi:hypothetical protein K788_0006656 [Paraburkholderia caribensis MBA4]|uniref:Uncharacterized protein n=1 Tax=Paraburkholderia caribensis MBA4 TaxID=1323664 RepID=A0A0P0R8A2_9BURK|nr:hypothetical protein K788_0006656 [Paraburkholderia caribensis MBA4]